MTTLSFLVITRDSEKRLDRVLKQSERFNPDDIVVCINDRTVDNTLDIAKKYTDKIYFLNFGGKLYPEVITDKAYSFCSSEWIFKLDDDELIGENFEHVTEKIENSNVNAYWFPRYHCVYDTNHYINCLPWYPDEQMKLFRKDKALPHSKMMDDATKVRGNNIHWYECNIFHMKFLQFNRQERERKWETRESKGNITRDGTPFFKPFVLYEDFENVWRDHVSETEEKPL